MEEEKDEKDLRFDGYKNLLNKYGTSQDNSTAYFYSPEDFADDETLVRLYEGNGLFTKIIDRPAEESVKHGLDIDFGSEEISELVEERLDELEFEDIFGTAEKWSRLYGGAIIVMIVDDGRGLEETLDWNNVSSIEELRVFDRSCVQPDYTELNDRNFFNTLHSNVLKMGEPTRYNVFSIYGTFTVHASRCLVFRNGRLPEKTSNTHYRFWGIPEYVKLKEALRECVTSHGFSVKLLEKCTQPIYKMKNLANLLATDEGEDKVIQRLQIIDMARGILNSIAIDNEGEDFSFVNGTMAGVSEVVNATCNMLSAVTDIPQSILFGKSPAGMNSTGEADLENYYNMVENIQKRNLKKNVRTLLRLIFIQAVKEGRIAEAPKYKVKFASLWSQTESEKIMAEQQKAGIQQVKAAVATAYIQAGVLDPTEVRKTLEKEGDFELDAAFDTPGEDAELNLSGVDFDLGKTISNAMTSVVADNINASEGNEEKTDAEVDVPKADLGNIIKISKTLTNCISSNLNEKDKNEDEVSLAETISHNIRLLREDEEDSEGKWVTLPNRVHIQVGEEGKVEKGPDIKESPRNAKEKSIKNLYPENTYQNAEYKKTAEKIGKLWNEKDEVYKSYTEKKKAAEKESTKKPRSEWTTSDEIESLMGQTPRKYTEEGQKLLEESKSLFERTKELEKEIEPLRDEMKNKRIQAHKKQLAEWESTEPKKATQQTYEGFSTLTTGTPYYDDVLKDGRGYIAEMSPKEYLQRCAYEIFDDSTLESTIDGANEKDVDKYAKQMRDGVKFDLPYLNYRDEGQEGRHRALAAYKNGYEKIPVLVMGYRPPKEEIDYSQIYTPPSNNESIDELIDDSWFDLNLDADDSNRGVGVIVVKDGKLLVGTRSDYKGLCGPGGHIEKGETPENAAIRETKEEFGITPKELVSIGKIKENDDDLQSDIFLCTEFEGDPKADEEEMYMSAWKSLEELREYKLFNPFKNSIDLLLEKLTNGE